MPYDQCAMKDKSMGLIHATEDRRHIFASDLCDRSIDKCDRRQKIDLSLQCFLYDDIHSGGVRDCQKEIVLEKSSNRVSSSGQKFWKRKVNPRGKNITF